MSEPIVILGAGNFALEILDVVDAINDSAPARRRVEVVGLLDDAPPAPETFGIYDLEPSQLGTIADLASFPPSVGYVIGAGDSEARRRLDLAMRRSRESPVLIHPHTFMGRRNVEVGPGTVICAQAGMTNHVTIGRHVQLHRGVSVGHDSRLGDYVTLSPQTCISGNAVAEEGAFFGTGSIANPGVRIGAGATVGSGAVVVRDVAPGATVVGIPARPR